MHHQGTRVHDGKMVTASTLWPTAIVTAQRLLAVDRRRRHSLQPGRGHGEARGGDHRAEARPIPVRGLSRYPGGTEPGISRNAYGLLGSGSVLLELRGGIGTKSGGYIQKIGYHASMAIVEELAKSATLAHIDPNLAEVLVIPANGVPPRQSSQGEAIVDGYVEAPQDDVDDDHLGN